MKQSKVSHNVITRLSIFFNTGLVIEFEFTSYDVRGTNAVIAQLIQFGMDLLALEKCRERLRWRKRIARWSYLHNFRIFSARLGDFMPPTDRIAKRVDPIPELFYAIIYECRIKILSMRVFS